MRLLAFIGVLAIIGVIGGAVYFFGGYYSVAGTAEDPPPVRWALVQIRRASVNHYATQQPPASLDTPENVQAGARAFLARGCANCHGGPGVPWAKFSEGLHPGPPDLKDAAPHLSVSQVFWVIKNGINMTGMPSFADVKVPDEEIWKIAAFVKKMPTVKDADFKAWTAPTAAAPAQPAPPQPGPAKP